MRLLRTPAPAEQMLTRVVHVSFGLEVGGQEKLLVEFARHAASKPVRAHLRLVGPTGAWPRTSKLADGWSSQCKSRLA